MGSGIRPFRLHKKSLTSDDLDGHWQLVRSAILATAELLVIFYETQLCHCVLSSSVDFVSTAQLADLEALVCVLLVGRGEELAPVVLGVFR